MNNLLVKHGQGIIWFCLFLASLGVILFLYAGSPCFLKNQYDDPYITYRYAVNLAGGQGLVFNAGERADAASSYLYTFILAGFYKLGLTDLEAVSGIIGILSAAGIAVIVYLSILYLTGNILLAVSGGLIAVTHGFISGWAVSGMETTFFTFLVSWFFYRYAICGRRDWLSVLIMALILLTRAEGVLVMFIWLAGEIYNWLFYPEKRSPLNTAIAVRHFLFLAAILTGLYLFKFFYYGTLVSHALQVKMLSSAYRFDHRYLIKDWYSSSSILLVLAFAGFFYSKRRGPWLVYSFILLSMISVVRGPSSDFSRYSVHLLPIVVVLSFQPLYSFLSRWALAGRILVTILILSCVYQAVGSAKYMKHYWVSNSITQRTRKQIGQYLSSVAKKGSLILSSDIGEIAYNALDNKFIDLTGLTSPEVLSCYLKSQNLDLLLLRKKPEFLADSFRLVLSPDSKYKPENTNKENVVVTWSKALPSELLGNPGSCIKGIKPTSLDYQKMLTILAIAPNIVPYGKDLIAPGVARISWENINE